LTEIYVQPLSPYYFVLESKMEQDKDKIIAKLQEALVRFKMLTLNSEIDLCVEEVPDRKLKVKVFGMLPNK
jgi:hypothetical protein